MIRSVFAALAVMMLAGTVILIPFGCSGNITGDSVDWVSFMSCPSKQLESGGNLTWEYLQLTPVGVQNLRPGDQVSIRGKITNIPVDTSISTNIPFASNMRIWLSEDNNLGREDYFVFEGKLSGLWADKSAILLDRFNVPRPTSPPVAPGNPDNYFPSVIPDLALLRDPNYNYDPGNPLQDEYIGPPSITYNVIAVVDAENCIIESGGGNAGGNEPSTRVDEHQSSGSDNFATPNPQTIEIWNPNLPNLKIRFLDRQPSSALPQTGGDFETIWEITNSGIGLVPAGTNITVDVLFSENSQFDAWDVSLGTGTVGGPIYGNQTTTALVNCNIPYTATRPNQYAGEFSSLDMWNGQDDFTSRDPPPANPPTYDFEVYCPIPNQGSMGNVLIGSVDSTNEITESVEHDNYSSSFGTKYNGTLDIGSEHYPGYPDIEAVNLVATYLNQQQEFQLTYHNANTADVCSIAYYLSENDTAQSADFYQERFWMFLLQGRNQLFDYAYAMGPLGGPWGGEKYLALAMDDIFRYKEENEANNHIISLSPMVLN